MLTEAKIKALRPKEKKYLEPDSKGLYLRVNPGGEKTWALKTYKDNKITERTLGAWPAMGLKEARQLRDEIKARLKSGLPAVEEKPTFLEVATEWYRLKTNARAYDEKTLSTDKYRLEHYIYPALGRLDIASIERRHIMKFLDEIANGGKLETAARCANLVQQVFRFALQRDIIKVNVATDLRTSLPTAKSEAFPHITKPESLGLTVESIWRLDTPVTREALLVAAYCFPRSGELLLSRWKEIDFEQNLWTIPREHTKSDRELLIPFPTQIREALMKLYDAEAAGIHKFRKMSTCLVFPTSQPRKGMERAVTNAALNKALTKIVTAAAGKGVLIQPTSVHGFRHTASSFLHSMGVNSLYIEFQLAHRDPNHIRSIYNSYDFLAERREMLQQYADYIDSLRVPI